VPERISGLRGEFLWEWDIAEDQLKALASAFPAGDYEWRPDTAARRVSEVLVHIACGTFMLLESVGIKAPLDLYPELPAAPEERLWALVHRNDELEQVLQDKDQVISFLGRAFDSVRDTITRTDDADIQRSVVFFGENTTVRRVYLRLLAHTHEHMGQLIGYIRMRGMAAPWADWRPDRRPS
jgi:hypothetical protein